MRRTVSASRRTTPARPHDSRHTVAIAAALLGVLAVDPSGLALAGTPQPGFMLQDATTAAGGLPIVAPVGMTLGVTAEDLDDDGHIDLIIPTDAGHRLQVYRNLGDGSFVEVSQQVALTDTRRVRGTLLVDLDADGRLDLLTASDCNPGPCPSHDALRLYRQLEDGTFADITPGSGLDGFFYTNNGTHAGGLAAGDLTGDGLLDLVVCYWNGRLRVFQNNGLNEQGDLTFTNITQPAGISTEQTNGWFWQPVILDFNNDGLQDIFVAVDFGPNRLFLNNGPDASGVTTFTDAAQQAGVATSWNEMGVAVGDYDNDGRFDLFVTNIYQFILGVQRHSVLFRNITPHDQVGGVPLFQQIAVPAGVANTGWGWGTTFFDADHDTLLDLAAVNGRAGSLWAADPSNLFKNMGPDAPTRFLDTAPAVGFADTRVSAGLVAADLDRDGRLDLVRTSVAFTLSGVTTPGQFSILMNRAEQPSTDANWLMVRPRMPDAPNHRAIGAVLRARIGDITLSRAITAGISMSGQEPAEAHFGLGNAAAVDELSILWPDGSSTTLTNIPANQLIVVTPVAPITCDDLDLDASGAIDSNDLSALLGHYGSPHPPADFDASGTVDMPDLAALLERFGQACR